MHAFGGLLRCRRLLGKIGYGLVAARLLCTVVHRRCTTLSTFTKMTTLPSETVQILEQTLKLYNFIAIDEIVVFTNELQYIGAYDNKEYEQQQQQQQQIGRAHV